MAYKYYFQEQLNHLLGLKNTESKNKEVIG